MNEVNFRLVIDKIKSCPAEWDQSQWHCGTKHCFAGWAQVLSGNPQSSLFVRRDARKFLGLSRDEADYYFASNRTFEDFQDPLTFDRDGFSRSGFSRAGFDRDGLNKEMQDKQDVQ